MSPRNAPTAGRYNPLIFWLSPPVKTNLALLDTYIYGKSNPPPNGAFDLLRPASGVRVHPDQRRPAGRRDVQPSPAAYSPKSITSDGRVYTGNGTGLVGDRTAEAQPSPRRCAATDASWS